MGMIGRRVLVMLGTRPEAIKLAPVIHEFRHRLELEVQVCATGQHDALLGQALEAFNLVPDIDAAVMSPNQSLATLTSRLFAVVDSVLAEGQPDWVLVQGDTTTAFVSAMAAYYRGIRVGHVEAGLRTGNRWAPFPEETNRRAVSLVADLHFAPTPRAAQNLRDEGIPDDAIVVTGNTVVDALEQALDRIDDQPPSLPAAAAALIDIARAGKGRMILVTGHRRESFGSAFEHICLALRDLVARFDDVSIVYPVHLNPRVQAPVRSLLAGHPRIALLEPLDYLPMVWLMRNAHLILTDSGGIQEEAPTAGAPVLVMRDATERPELLEAGWGRLVGTTRVGIVTAASEVLTSMTAYEAMRPRFNPFGDGKAAVRIADALVATP